MKCAICSKHLTEERYAAHLETKHGATPPEADADASSEVAPGAEPEDETAEDETAEDETAEDETAEDETAEVLSGPPTLVVPPPQLVDGAPEEPTTELPPPAVPISPPPPLTPTIGPATARRWPRVAASLAVAAVLFTGAFFVARAINDDNKNKTADTQTAAERRAASTPRSTSTTVVFGALPPVTVPGPGAPRPGAPSTTPPPRGTPPASALPGAAGQMQFSFAAAECGDEAAGTSTGPLSINGSVHNAGTGTYNLQFTVTVLRGDIPIGTATSAVNGLGPGEQRSFVAKGTCSEPLGGNNRAEARIDSVTPA